MPVKKYTHLFFDLDNTLWDFTTNSYRALRLALIQLDLLDQLADYDDFFEVYSTVNDALWDQYRKGTITKKALSAERFDRAFQNYGSSISITGEIVNQTYLDQMPTQTKLIDGAREVLDYLYGKYEMAIITNGFREVQHHKIKRSELSKYFKKIFISEEIGAQKPKKEIFEHAIKSMNAPKKSTLMIGDSWEADILGARNFGIDQIYFNPNNDFCPEISISEVCMNNNLFIDTSIGINGGALNINGKNQVETLIIPRLSQIMKIL